MADIPINEPDGSEPSGICLGNRSRLIDRYQIDAMIALKYFSEDLPVCDDETARDAEAVGHVRSCPKCRAWISHVIPKSILRRQQRLTRYCCARMFVAVEEPDGAKNHIQFELFRNEDPCWKIDGKWSFISHCPWCGTKLPKEPFLTD
ncbi:MAG: hypothetical protein ACSHYF_05640 [Verrucomicrobiaceae bacterium]